MKHKSYVADRYVHDRANFLVTQTALELEPNGLLRVDIEPGVKGCARRMLEMTLRIEPGGEDSGQMHEDLQLTLTDSSGKLWCEGGRIQLLATFNQLAQSRADPYVSVEPANSIRLDQLRVFYSLLNEVDKDAGIRIEPPGENHLYYRAFLPDQKWRNRSERIIQPWELRLIRSEDGVLRGELVDLASRYNTSTNAQTKTRSFSVESSGALAATLKKSEKRYPSLLIFTTGDLAYSDLLSFIQPAMPTHPFIHVFLHNDQFAPIFQ